MFENVRSKDLVVESVEAVGGLRLRLAIELPLKAADLIRRCKAHRQSPRPQSSSASMSEVRGLGSAGITRPRRSNAPVRLPPGPPPKDDVEACASPRSGLPCLLSSLSSDVL